MDNPLHGLRGTIRRHWRRYRPRTCRALEKEGLLEASIETAARNTEEAVAELVSRGVHPWDAWQQVREEWAILPPEEGWDEDETDEDEQEDDRDNEES